MRRGLHSENRSYVNYTTSADAFSNEEDDEIKIICREWQPIDDVYYMRSDGLIESRARGRLRRLRSYRDRDGYEVINLRGRKKFVHRLVLEVFFGPCPDGHEADHLDFDRANNEADNLRWCPIPENRARRRNRRNST